jgi:hypothetical protein
MSNKGLYSLPSHIGFISRGDDTLKDPNIQLEYFTAILTAPLTLNYDPLLLKLRKLREALISTARMDSLTVEVFEKSVDISLLASNFEELNKSLLHLSKVIYPVFTRSLRIIEMESYHLLFRLDDRNSFQKMYNQMSDVLKSSKNIQTIIKIFKAIQFDLDYVSLSNCWESLDKNQKMILENQIAIWRGKILVMFQKAFYTYPSKLFRRHMLFSGDEADWDKIIKEYHIVVVDSNNLAFKVKLK